jgi:hypothetical protein
VTASKDDEQPTTSESRSLPATEDVYGEFGRTYLTIKFATNQG